MSLNITLPYVSLADKISKVVIVSDIITFKVIYFIVLEDKLLYYLTQNLFNIKLLTSGINHRFKNIFRNINICLSLIKHNKNTEDILGNCNAKTLIKKLWGFTDAYNKVGECKCFSI